MEILEGSGCTGSKSPLKKGCRQKELPQKVEGIVKLVRKVSAKNDIHKGWRNKRREVLIDKPEGRTKV